MPRTIIESFTSESVSATLRQSAVPGDTWLWCLHCKRFFQARRLRRDFVGGQQGCAFVSCEGAGFDVDIFVWDAWRDPEDARWPASAAQLRHGLRSPADDFELIAQRIARQRDAIVDGYAASAEHAALGTGAPPRWVPAFVEYVVSLGGSTFIIDALTESLLESTAEDAGWSAADVPAALAEVSAYFGYLVHAHADHCGDAAAMSAHVLTPGVQQRLAAYLDELTATRRDRIRRKAGRR